MPDPLPGAPRTLVAITLLSMVAGLVDAVVYTRHGHVFANAMTGNVTLMGVALASHQRGEILRHAVPLASFGAGVFAGKVLLRVHRASALHVTLLLQMAALALAGVLPQTTSPNLLVAMVSLTSAIQVTTIRRADHVPFNVTFMTGNFRSMFEGAFDALFPPPADPPVRSHGGRQFVVVGLSVSGFLTGACLGAVASTLLQDRTFWIGDLLLLPAGLLLYRREPTDV